jgi:amino acid transporter
MEDPKPKRESLSPFELLMFGLGAFSIGFVVGTPAFLFGKVMGLENSVFLLAIFIFFSVILPILFDLLSRDGRDSLRTNPKAALLVLTVVGLGLVSGCWAGLQIFKPEVS